MIEGKKMVETRFEKSRDYRRVHATTFWGTVNSLGEIELDIVEDVREAPEIIKTKLPEKTEERIPDENDIIRMKRIQHIGVSISINAAPDLIKWLQDKIIAYEEIQKRKVDLKS